MLFNSPIFLFAFLPVTYGVFWLLRTKNARYVWLAVTGYVFYGYWNPAFCLLMAFSTLVSYTAGLAMLRLPSGAPRRRWALVLPITVDLCLLGYFKYAGFGIRTINWFLEGADLRTLPVLDIVLPVGISFYTFHTISYIVDCYRGVVKPTRNLAEFACYVSLFSQLVAGPIVRFRELEEDLERIDGRDRRRYLDVAWSFFVIGLVEKVLIADTLAAVIDPALARGAATLSTATAWLCMLGYSYQLYFDFAGYSNMAVGLGFLFGLRIPQNFNSPYKATSPADFWRRWHISLSRCMRDYLYIPLGGNRAGRLLTYRNLMLTMLIGGLWHGAAWTFVLWGAYHGALLVLYHRHAALWDARPLWLRRGAMFLLALLGWTLFRAESFGEATALLTRMLVPAGGEPIVGVPLLLTALVIAGALAHFAPNTFEIKHQWKPRHAAALALLFLACVVRIFGSANSPFLYFQF